MEVSDIFRQVMRRLASTVCIVSCARDGNRFGITATAVTSLCAEPASVIVCINASRAINAPLLQKCRFYINLLHIRQEMISRAFGGEAAKEERFSMGDWCDDPSGHPYLLGAQANLLCNVEKMVTYETHNIVIARVINGRYEDEVSPLVYQNGRYARTISLENAILVQQASLEPVNPASHDI